MIQKRNIMLLQHISSNAFIVMRGYMLMFLDASTHLYTGYCPSVRPLVCLFVRYGFILKTRKCVISASEVEGMSSVECHMQNGYPICAPDFFLVTRIKIFKGLACLFFGIVWKTIFLDIENYF